MEKTNPSLMEPRQETVRCPNSDFFRLLLALEVVFVHAWFTVDPNFNWDGFLMAVPCFLAISGFLVLQSYDTSSSWKHFLWKRMLRVVPALLISFIISGIAFGYSGLFNSFLNWLTGGFYKGEGGFNNGPLWSLAWEELAYLCLAGLWLSRAYRRPQVIWFLLAVSVVMIWQTTGLTRHGRLVTFLAPSFLVGNLMYLYRRYLLRVYPAIPWLILFLAINWKHFPAALWLGGASIPIVQSFAVVLVSMAGAKAIPFRFPDISYGIYVYHYPIVAYLGSTFGIHSLPALLFWSCLILIPLCLSSWYLVEKPILKYKNMAGNPFV